MAMRLTCKAQTNLFWKEWHYRNFLRRAQEIYYEIYVFAQDPERHIADHRAKMARDGEQMRRDWYADGVFEK